MPDYPGPPQTIARPGFDACDPDVRAAPCRFRRVIARSSRVDDLGEPGGSGRGCPTTKRGAGLEERWDEVEAERPRDPDDGEKPTPYFPREARNIRRNNRARLGHAGTWDWTQRYMRGTWSRNPFPGPGSIPCCPVSISSLAAIHRQHGFLPIEPARQQITVWITGSGHRIEGKESSALLTGPVLAVQLGRRRPDQICSCHSESGPDSLSVDRFMASIIERRLLPCWTDRIGLHVGSFPGIDTFNASCSPYLTAGTEYQRPYNYSDAEAPRDVPR